MYLQMDAGAISILINTLRLIMLFGVGIITQIACIFNKMSICCIFIS